MRHKNGLSTSESNMTGKARIFSRPRKTLGLEKHFKNEKLAS